MNRRNARNEWYDMVLKEIANKSKLQGSPKMVFCEICENLEEDIYTFGWKTIECWAGIEKRSYEKLGYKKCKKSEATACMMYGDTSENGNFIVGKHKRVWLRK